MAAFDRLDIGALARVLREDVELEMPPVPMWFAGRAATLTFFTQYVFQVVLELYVDRRLPLAGVAAGRGTGTAPLRRRDGRRLHGRTDAQVVGAGPAIRTGS